MNSPRYAFEAITLSHDTWDSRFVLVCLQCVYYVWRLQK